MDKVILFLFSLISIVGNAQDVNTLRAQYPEAVESSAITAKMDAELFKVENAGKPVLLAYKGAVLTLKAKFSKKKSEKKEFFKEGVGFIESAVSADGSNIEIRYIRLSVQENLPRFLGYHKNMEEDKQYLLKYYSTISTALVKEVVRDFVMKSVIFDESEKKLFD